jgi:hypothetical protein
MFFLVTATATVGTRDGYSILENEWAVYSVPQYDCRNQKKKSTKQFDLQIPVQVSDVKGKRKGGEFAI